MKQWITIGVCVAAMSLASCHKFLAEEPAGFLSPDKYYTTENQVQAAVNGAYTGLDDVFVTGIGVANSPFFMLEYLTGYSIRVRQGGAEDNQFLRLDYIDPASGQLADWWRATYYPLENCNSVIDNLSRTTILSPAAKDRYLGEVYFLRAWYYFQAVRIFGNIPLKTTPTTDLSNIRIPKAPQEQVYNQVVADLKLAEQSGLPWTDASGRVTMGAIKSLLVKVYATMAGFPLKKGNAYYQLAYDKAKEVIGSKQFTLFPKYEDLRKQSLQNTGEHIFMMQREAVTAGNILHFFLMPFPDLPITIQPAYGGGLAPRPEFYNSYEAGDKRAQEQVFFYTKYPEYRNPSNVIAFPQTLIFKYWDELAEQTGKSGLNFGWLRYADILLLCAETKANVDGGSTSDATAVDAYYQVMHRALPNKPKPVNVTANEALKERFLELCFEWQTWFDMVRTRKALNTTTGQMADLIGFQAPNHVKPFTEKDLLMPIPLSEVQKNPLLK